MGSTVTVLVPAAKDVVVKGFTNASYLQRITISATDISAIVFIGSGEGNTLIGESHFTTPGSSGYVQISVTLEFSTNGGIAWNAPETYSTGCVIQAYNLAVVVADDLVDQDYNDAVCMISWPGRAQSPQGSFDAAS